MRIVALFLLVSLAVCQGYQVIESSKGPSRYATTLTGRGQQQVQFR